jgi:hypothetical protein
MTTRTLQILGNGFGSTPANITAIVEGTTVFSGPVPTLNQSLPELPNLSYTDQSVVLFSFDHDVDFTGTLPITYEVTGSPVLFTNILSNYSRKLNNKYTSEQLNTVLDYSSAISVKIPVFQAVTNSAITPEDVLLLESSSVPFDPYDPKNESTIILSKYAVEPITFGNSNTFGSIYWSSDLYLDSTIDGELVDRDSTAPLLGNYWFSVPAGSVFVSSLNIYRDPT